MKKKWVREAGSWLLCIAGPLLSVMVLTSTVFAITTVNQESMQPGLVQGDVLYCSRAVGVGRPPAYGDVVLFYADGRLRSGFLSDLGERFADLSDTFRSLTDRRNIRYVKRVIGLPGDEIDIVDGRVVRNGEVLDEPFVRGDTLRKGMTVPVVVPDGALFLLGDNREFSRDSREIGMIDIRSVEGIARVQLWPPADLGRIP